MAERESLENKYDRLVATAWSDEAFKQQLIADPLGSFHRFGIEFPPGKQVRVVEDKADMVHYILPAKPSAADDWTSRVNGGLPDWYQQIVSRAWSDAGFKQRLLADPATAARECGVPVSASQSVVVLEDTDTVLHFPLPKRPADEELLDEELEMVAGGKACKQTQQQGGCGCTGVRGDHTGSGSSTTAVV
jgi:hypothetical protein